MHQGNLVWLLLCSLVVGVSMASQAGINAQLRESLHSPVQAAFISFLVGTLVLGVIAFGQQQPWFRSGALTHIPWWAWLGGFLGAFNIAVSIFLAPKLGALLLAVSIICGQVIASLVYDHNGWLGYPTISLSPTRVLGAVLMVVGVVLVTRK